jgi:hypothetical protein
MNFVFWIIIYLKNNLIFAQRTTLYPSEPPTPRPPAPSWIGICAGNRAEAKLHPNPANVAQFSGEDQHLPWRLSYSNGIPVVVALPPCHCLYPAPGDIREFCESHCLQQQSEATPSQCLLTQSGDREARQVLRPTKESDRIALW